MGTGIGLHLVKEYIHMHGGEIRVESEPGQRTTFTVCLRKGKAHFEDSDLMETSVSHQAYEASRLDDSETHKMLSKTYPYTILITEDDDEVRCFLERELSPHFKTRTAANGKDALRVLEEEEISLVVSDVMMPTDFRDYRRSGRLYTEAFPYGLREDQDYPPIARAPEVTGTFVGEVAG